MSVCVSLMAIVTSTGLYVGHFENVAGLFGEIPVQIARLWQYAVREVIRTIKEGKLAANQRLLFNNKRRRLR